MKINKKIVLGVAVCLVLVVLSFSGGMIYGKGNVSKSDTNRQGQFAQRGFDQYGGERTGNQGMMRGGVNGGGFVSGEVLSIDDKSMTVKLPNGGSKIVFFSPSTKVEKTVDGTTADIVIGKQVMVTGTASADGSVSATSIQLRPTFVKDVQIKQ
jgi:hypothetical protein